MSPAGADVNSLLPHSPGRHIAPPCELLGSPGEIFIRVTTGAGIWDLVSSRHGRRDEPEGVASYVHVRHGLLDFRHVTRYTLTARAARLMVRVLLNGAGVGTIWRPWAVAFQAHNVRRFYQQGVITGAVYIMTAGTFHAMRIHHALSEVVTLHPVFMSRSVRKMGEGSFAEFVFFELPEVL